MCKMLLALRAAKNGRKTAPLTMCSTHSQATKLLNLLPNEAGAHVQLSGAQSDTPPACFCRA